MQLSPFPSPPTSIYNILKRKSVKHKKLASKQETLMFQCHRCLHNIKKTTHYFDETWVSVGCMKQIVWQYSTIRYTKDAFLKGLPMGRNTTSGKGMLLFVVHTDCGMRFVNNGP
jgi:hypothetical protein